MNQARNQELENFQLFCVKKLFALDFLPLFVLITSRISSELFAFWSHATFRPVGIVLGIQTLFLTKIQQQPLRARIINDFFFQIFNNVTQNLVNFNQKFEKPFVTMKTVKNIRQFMKEQYI